MKVAVVCPGCETRTEVDASTVGSTLRTHTESRHGGEAVASVAGEHVDRLVNAASGVAL